MVWLLGSRSRHCGLICDRFLMPLGSSEGAAQAPEAAGPAAHVPMDHVPNPQGAPNPAQALPIAFSDSPTLGTARAGRETRAIARKPRSGPPPTGNYKISGAPWNGPMSARRLAFPCPEVPQRPPESSDPKSSASQGDLVAQPVPPRSMTCGKGQPEGPRGWSTLPKLAIGQLLPRRAPMAPRPWLPFDLPP